MEFIVKMKFGSQVYGTSTPESDTDYKAIYLPSANDILLQKVKGSINQSTGNDKTKNTKDDVDMEILSLQKYLQLLSEGQTVALDMLFVPDEHIIETSPTWEYIRANKDQFLSSQYNSFVGYCMTQASKYGIKGSRMAAVKKAIEFFKDYKIDSFELRLSNRINGAGKDRTILEIAKEYLANEEFISFIDSEIPMIEINNRKFQETMKVSQVIETLETIYNKYGERAKMAESNEGIDWKALNHALRICNQAQELLSTHKITFPRPEAQDLLKIRKGLLPYIEVQTMIENGVKRLEDAQKVSTLPKSPNHEFIENLVLDAYKTAILKE